MALIESALGEYVLQYAAKKAADAGLAHLLRELKSHLRNPFIKPAFADKYLTLSSLELVEFYGNDSPHRVDFGGETFVLPIVLALPPRGGGELHAQQVEFRFSPDSFAPPKTIDAFTAPMKEEAQRNKLLFNGKVVRLGDLSVTDSGAVVSICPADYFDALATNFSMDHSPKGKARSLRQHVHGESRSIGAFSGSPLANPVGLVCMIETADGHLIAQSRSAKVTNRAKTISSSASGTLDVADVRALKDAPFGLSALGDAVAREVKEELGVELKDIRFLGLVREFIRGGEPDFYFYARSESSYRDVCEAYPQAESVAESKTLYGYDFYSEQVRNNDNSKFTFQQNVRNILEVTGKSSNLTFVVGTLLASQHVLRTVSGA